MKMKSEELGKGGQESRSDIILTNLLDAIIILDTAGYILYANKAAETLFGKTEERLVGENFGYPVVPYEIHELQIVRDSRVLRVEMLATTIEWKGEDVFLMSLRDVSEKRTLQDELTIAYQQLQQKTENLDKLNGMLLQSNDALQQFAHVASHDLKEPLRKIRTYIGRINHQHAAVIPAECTKYLKKIEEASLRMVHLIDGILNYSTLNATNEPAAAVNLSEVIKDVETDLELVVQQKKAVIIHNGLPTVQGARVLLHQLFYNLINNALKFSSKDRPPVITIGGHIQEKGDYSFARISVRDNGIGFEPEHADKIFDSFSRLHTKDMYDGTGLGLALCRKIVQRHEGSIRATGRPDQGAEFEIILPLKQRDKTI
jgi:light-regulated signal transduction histidine kinase (bacteriophytochrome)